MSELGSIKDEFSLLEDDDDSSFEKSPPKKRGHTDKKG